MDFEEMAAACALAKGKTLAEAARALQIEEEEVTRRIHRQEKEVGQPLFRVLGNEYLPTYAGERFVEKARLLLAMRRELSQEMADIQDSSVGELKIAFPIMRGTYMLPCTLPVFHSEYPNVKISVHEANSEALEQMVLRGEVDIAFFTLPIQSADITHEVIKREEVLLVLSPSHPLAGVGASKPDCRWPWVDIRRFENEAFILQKKDQRTRHIGDKLFEEAGFEPKVALYVRNILASLQLALGGYAVTLASESHLRHIHTPQEPVCFSVGHPRTETSFVAAWRRGSYLPGFARRYIEIVREFT